MSTRFKYWNILHVRLVAAMVLRIIPLLIALSPVLIIAIALNQLVIGVRGLTIEEKRRQVNNIENAVKSLPFINYNDSSCDPKTFEAFELIYEKVSSLKEEEIFHNATTKDLYEYLKKSLLIVQKLNAGKPLSEQKGIICKYKRGMECSNTSNTCQCRPWGSYKSPPNEGCFISEFSPCNSEFELLPHMNKISCQSPLRCAVDTYTIQGETKKITNTSCSSYGRWALNASSVNCNCYYPDAAKLDSLKQLSAEAFNLPFHSYGSACVYKAQQYYLELNYAIAEGNENVYGQKMNLYLLQQMIQNATGSTPKSPLFCDKGAYLTCDETEEKCGCLNTFVYSDTQKKCVARSGTLCSQGEPFPCIPGEHCLFREVPDVECSERNKNEISNLTRFYLSLPKDFSDCQCSSQKFQTHFNNLTISRLKAKSDSDIRKEVRGVNDAIIQILDKDSPCNWTHHELWYFEIQDFIAANLEHVFYRTETYKALKSLKSDGTYIQVCDRKKSMACGFISRKCDCPVDNYYRTRIFSMYNATTDSCHLKPGSLCHATLTEWLPCSPGEKCIYEAVPFLCNRKNKKVVTDNNLRFENGSCSCSDKPYKNEFDEDSIKKYSVSNEINLIS